MIYNNTNNLIKDIVKNDLNSNTYIKRYNSNVSVHNSKLKGKITGIIKHNVPANKEWKDSVYLYNENNMKTIPVKHNMLDKLIKNYFNINALKKIARSKRMRSRLIRSSSRKLFVSSPEIKQNNDKTIITVYVFNREKQFYVRKLFFLVRKPMLYNTFLKKGWQKKVKFSNLVRKRKLVFKKIKKRKPKKRFIPYYNIKYKNETDFFIYKISRLYNKCLFLDKFFIFSFVSRILSLFNMKLVIPFNIKNKDIFIKNILNKKLNAILWIDGVSNKLKITRNNLLNENIINKIISGYASTGILKDKELLNNLLWRFTINNFINTNYISNNKINYLYKIFVYKKYKKILYKYFKKAAKFYYNFGKLQVNKLKFTTLLPSLKTLISRIYNKSTELNIVSLKYIHLSSDIFTQAITLKIKKKKSLLKVLRKSLKLAKVPFEFYYWKKRSGLNKLLDMNIYKSLNINSIPKDNMIMSKNNDWLNDLLKRLFPSSTIHGISKPIKKKNTYYTNNKVIDILDAVKFKWVTGLRLEAAGRLTRRNTASRSMFKFKYKGNLENKQHYTDLGVLKVMPALMLRNIAKINTQYTLTSSKKRIGSFGIKSWISGY